jgi:hypothetical protein
MLATQPGSRRPFVETQVFANALRWLCHAGLGTETETAFSNGFEASARPSSESDIQRARAIPASDKRFAKKGRVAGTQKRIGLNVPERSALLISAHIVWAGCAYKGTSMLDRRASERMSIRYAILPRLSAYVRAWPYPDRLLSLLYVGCQVLLSVRVVMFRFLLHELA